MARVRLPLEVGVSSLNNLVYGIVMIPIGLAVLGGLVAAILWLDFNIDDFIIYPAVFGCGLVGGGAWCLRKAWRERPSDALFDGHELTVDGGAYDGLNMKFAALDPAKCVVEPQFKMKDGKQEPDGFGLVLGDRYGQTVLIGIADSDTDVQSLRDLCASIIEQCTTAAPVGRLLDENVRWLVCPGCATVVPPTDAEAVVCPGACGTSIPMTEDIRTRVRALQTLSRDQARVDRAAPKLLDQPGARTMSRHLGISLALIGLAWPVAAVMVLHLAKHHALTPQKGALIALLPFLLIADGFFLSRLRLVDRRALSTVTLGYAAIPPARPGAPPTCHQCNAPLPATPAVVGRCLFCGIENLMNLDVRPSAKRAEQAAITLDEALRARAAERRFWRWATIVSAPIFVVTALVVRHLW